MKNKLTYIVYFKCSDCLSYCLPRKNR